MKIIRTIVAVAAIAVVAFIVVLNITFAVQERLGLYFLVVLACFVALILTFRHVDIPERPFLICFVLVALVAKIGLSLWIDAAPVSDFARLYEAAKQVSAGDFSFQTMPYFQHWSYQTGFVLYEAFVIRLFGTGTTALIVLNGIQMTMTNLLVYGFIRKVSGNKACAMLGGILYLFYPAPYFLGSVLTNQHLATLFLLLGLYCIVMVERNRLLYTLLAGVFIALGNIIHPIGIVPFVAVLLYLLLKFFEGIRDGFKKGLVRWGSRAVSFAAVYVCVGLLLSALVVVSGINVYGIKNDDPLWKFAVGLNPQSGGTYSADIYERVSNASDSEERTKIESVIISENLSAIAKNPLHFIYDKNRRMWASYESTAWSFGADASANRTEGENTFWQRVAIPARKLDKCYYLIVLVLLLFGLGWAVKKRRVKLSTLLFVLVFLIYFGVHLLVEVQPRYRYFAMPIVFIVASCCAESLFHTKPLLRLSKRARMRLAGSSNSEMERS